VSKIEDALKKAKTTRKSLTVSPVKNRNDDVNSIVSGRVMSVVKESATSLIKFMKVESLADDDELLRKGIILPDSSGSKVTDSFRYLRTKLLQKAKNENFVVLVTSCSEGEDSAFVAMNMGAAFSFDESKTSLVIDCDFQSNDLEEMLELDYELGLLDFLEKGIGVNEILMDVGIKRVRVIPSGKKDHVDSEYFTAERMKVLLDDLVERYQDRYVFLNSSSISASVDASMLVDLVDYVVLVVPYGKVSGDVLEESIKKIDESKLLGVILNDIPEWS
jgi:protein-tyrosine kinase